MSKSFKAIHITPHQGIIAPCLNRPHHRMRRGHGGYEVSILSRARTNLTIPVQKDTFDHGKVNGVFGFDWVFEGFDD